MTKRSTDETRAKAGADRGDADVGGIARGEAGAGRGGIQRALRRSPMVGADIDLTRMREDGRDRPDAVPTPPR